MPFKSEKQRRYMHANEPEIADEWEAKENNEMKIKGSELKQMIKEELIKLIKEGGMYQPGRAVSGIGRSMLVTAAGDTPEDIAREMLESGQEITEETVTEAALDAGVLDDDLPDFIDAIINTLQDEDWESQVWKDASAQRGAQRPSHRPRMMDATNPSAVVSKSDLKEAVKEALLSEMGCGDEHYGHEQHSMPMSTGLSLGGMETGAPIIVIQSSEEEKLPAETHPTRIYHKEKKPDIGIQDIIPMLLQLEGKVVQFKSKDLNKYVKRSLKRVLREAERSGFNMGSIAGSIPASTFKREDDEDNLEEHDDEMHDLTKGERPPPHSTGAVTRKNPDQDTEASMTPNYEVEIEQLVFDMLMSGMSEQEIMGMVEEYVQDASTSAK